MFLRKVFPRRSRPRRAQPGRRATYAVDAPYRPTLMLMSTPEYRARYETLGRRMIVRTHEDQYERSKSNAYATKPWRTVFDWYTRCRLTGIPLTVMTDYQWETVEAMRVANDTGASTIILGPNSTATPYGELAGARESWEKVSRTIFRDEGGIVYMTPVGVTEDLYERCCLEMIEWGVDGLCIAPYVQIEWINGIVSRLARPGLRFHAHNPFANPFDAYRVREYRWLNSVSTDHPFRAATQGKRYVDGVTGSTGFSGREYRKWKAPEWEGGLTPERLSDADWNHMQMLRIWNGYVGAIPGSYRDFALEANR